MTVEERLLKEHEAEIDEILTKGYDCLFEALGFVKAQKFISAIMQKGRETPPDYTEWRREHLFEDMTDEELKADILRYAKTHNLE